MIDHNKKFQAILDGLNDAQQQAVGAVDGPVMVIAGPGTGKTQILAARVGNILRSTDTFPENILCLTFTEAATVAMRNRLLDFIGPDAYRVGIFTFHGFCNTVLQDHPEISGLRDLEPISDLERIELLKELIDGFENKHPLKRWTGDVYFDLKRLNHLFALMKREGWDANYIAQQIRSYLDDKLTEDGYYYKRGEQQGKPTKKWLELEKRLFKLVAASEEFANFQQLMLERRKYDYDDMVLWVLEAFKKDESILLDYQERYHYFLVDEYQDTNGAQYEILDLLSGYFDIPNVFIVGDEDQSIYRFQGANVGNIRSFYEKYGSAITAIALTDNYRSSQQILNAAGDLIRYNTERLADVFPGFSKKLKAANEKVADIKAQPSVVRYPNSIQEIIDVSRQIEALLEAGEKPSEIAVIYRQHRQAEDILKYLHVRGIAVNIKRNENVLESALIRRILAVLTYLSLEAVEPNSREDLLFEILHFEFFGIQPLRLAALAGEMRNRRYGPHKTTWRERLNRPPKGQPGLFDGDYEEEQKIANVGHQLELLISDYANKTLQGLLEEVMARLGVLSYIMESDEKVWLMQELTTFFEFIKRESYKNPDITVTDLLETIDLMKQQGIELNLVKTAAGSEGVHFLTVHGSKGLEFEHVFMIGCESRHWVSKRSPSQFSFPGNLVPSTVEMGDPVEESRRLFYVGMTRAKTGLYISYADKDKTEMELERCRFVAELEESELVNRVETGINDEQLLQFGAAVMMPASAPKVELLNRNYLQRLLEKYSLSVTHLNNYLRCPLGFYYQNLLRVPAAKNQFMTFGSAVHHALEMHFTKMLEHAQQVFPDEKTFTDDFLWYMNRHRDSFTRDQYRQKVAYGLKILPAYREQYIGEWSRKVSIEKAIRGVEMNGVPINGKLDKIEFDGKTANVVDYKTGQFAKAKRKFSPPASTYKNENEPTHEEKYGGDYWRQAVFYRILIDADRTKDWLVTSSEFDFVEPDDKTEKFEKKRVRIEDEDIELVKKQIEETYGKIMNHEFHDGCGEAYCRWCSFVESNKLSTLTVPEEWDY